MLQVQQVLQRIHGISRTADQISGRIRRVPGMKEVWDSKPLSMRRKSTGSSAGTRSARWTPYTPARSPLAAPSKEDVAKLTCSQCGGRGMKAQAIGGVPFVGCTQYHVSGCRNNCSMQQAKGLLDNDVFEF